MFSMIMAIAIFVIMFGLIIWDKVERHIVTLVCGLATVVLVFGVSMRSFNAFWALRFYSLGF